MMVTHHAYNIVKLLGSGGTIVIRGDEKDSVRSLERAYKDAATKRVSLDANGTGATVVIDGSLSHK